MPVQDPPQESQGDIGHARPALIGNLVEKPHKVGAPDIIYLPRSQPRIN